MGIPGNPPLLDARPRRDAGFSAEVFHYSFAKGPADDDGTPQDDGTPPADAPRPATGRTQRAHPGGLPPRRPATRRPFPHAARPTHRAASPRLLPPPQERPQVRLRIAGDRLQRHQVLLFPHHAPRLADTPEAPHPHGEETPRRALGR